MKFLLVIYLCGGNGFACSARELSFIKYETLVKCEQAASIVNKQQNGLSGFCIEGEK